MSFSFSMINMVGDWLPVDYDEAPGVFSENEKEAISKFMELADIAADAADKNTWDIDWFKCAEEWVRLSEFAQQALAVFSERGRFSEEFEEVLPT